MDLNIQKPDWLTTQKIDELKEYINNCENPYTDDEFDSLPFDGGYDVDRYNALFAQKMLKKYGIKYNN